MRTRLFGDGRVAAILTISLALPWAVAGCSGSSKPTAPSPVVQSVTVSGIRTLAEGETLQLTATQTLSSGATSDVTGSVTWSTDDPAIVAVNQQGMVTALAEGHGRIRATLQAVSGTGTVTVVSSAVSFIGQVHESFPTQRVMIAGATVTAVDDAGRTQSAISDASGRFTLRLRPGTTQLTADAAGYERATASVTAGPTSIPTAEIAMVPVLREVRVEFRQGDPKQIVPDRRFVIDVHHAGELRAEYTQVSDLASALSYICLEVRDVNNKVLGHTQGGYDFVPRPILLNIVPGTYTVIFSTCTLSNNSSYIPEIMTMTKYAGAIKHPS